MQMQLYFNGEVTHFLCVNRKVFLNQLSQFFLTYEQLKKLD